MYVTHTVNINKNKGGKNMKKKISVIALIMLLIITIAGGVQAYQSTAKNTSYSNVKNNVTAAATKKAARIFNLALFIVDCVSSLVVFTMMICPISSIFK